MHLPAAYRCSGTEEVWAERIRKAQIRAKRRLTDEHKHRCRFGLFITNTTKEMLEASNIIQLYYLRWQIELVFKRGNPY